MDDIVQQLIHAVCHFEGDFAQGVDAQRGAEDCAQFQDRGSFDQRGFPSKHPPNLSLQQTRASSKIVMAFAPDGTLRELLDVDPSTPLDDDNQQDYVIQLCHGFIYLHDKKVAHMGFKSLNVLRSCCCRRTLHIWTNTCVRVCVYMCVFVYVCVCLCMSVRVYVRVCV